jgi:L-asparaginase / beta-aspartyl-peptidase
MKYLFVFFAYVFCVLAMPSNAQNGPQDSPRYVLVIHGGAGNFNSASFSSERYKEYEKTLEFVLLTGDSLLKNGAKAVDVVAACIMIMEDSPLFNAGKGAVLNEEGNNELDASIMDGLTMRAGAVAGVARIKNPVSAAKKVMDDGTHVLLSGYGAEVFAEKNGIEIVDPSYFFDPGVYDKYMQIKQQGKGTVGAVVLDTYGNLAAGTSTGGMMMKKYGRIGDSPIIGAGTYADNNCCAVSCTGHGEFFIRFVAAYDVCALMKYGGKSLEDAASAVISKIGDAGGTGGLIAVDKYGNIAMPFNTTSMFRAFIQSDGSKYIEF